MDNIFVFTDFPDKPTHRIGIADLTGFGEMVPGTRTITRVNIPPEYRGQGFGSQLLKKITDAADAEKVILTLEIMPSGPLDYDALYDWYVRNGFSSLSQYPGILVRYPK